MSRESLHAQEQPTSIQAAQQLTNPTGLHFQPILQPPSSPNDDGVDTVWIYGSDIFRRVVPGCRILFYSSHGGWQVGLVWQVKADRHHDPRRKRPLTWRVWADKVSQSGSPDVHQLNTGKVHWRLLQAPDSSALEFFGVTTFEDIIDGTYESVPLESSLGIIDRPDPARAPLPPIFTEHIEEMIFRIRDMRYLLSLPGCLPPHKRPELGSTYLELVQAIHIQPQEPFPPRQTHNLTELGFGHSTASQFETPDSSFARSARLGFNQPGSSSGRQSQKSDEVETSSRETRRPGSSSQHSGLSLREQCAKSVEELNSTFKSRVDELFFSDARSQLWDAIIKQYAASSAAVKEQYSEVAEHL